MPRIHDNLTQAPYHIGYRLFGSVPQNIIEQLTLQRDQQLSQLVEDLARMPSDLRQETKDKEKFRINAAYEMAVEKALHDLNTPGPRHLSEANLAQIVLDSWLNMQERGVIYVYAICVMSNHVHVVIRAPDGVEETSLPVVMKSHKGFTARKINEQLNKTGTSFWESDYFDRRVRTGKFNTVMWYVLNNPVTAGLVESWKDWPYTYLNPEFAAIFGGK